jgi:Holliday junction resolvase RusA-like endonuclease
MPAKYVDWKEEFATRMAAVAAPSAPIDVPVHLYLSFESDAIGINMKPIPAATRPKYMRTQDIDNLSGGVMDAMQDAGVIDNDLLVYELSARVRD